jgi:hypothetical protein
MHRLHGWEPEGGFFANQLLRKSRMSSFWIHLAALVFFALQSTLLFLIAYRVVGKPRGQDPKYDTEMDYWSGSLKVLAVIGIIAVFFELLSLLIEMGQIFRGGQ